MGAKRLGGQNVHGAKCPGAVLVLRVLTATTHPTCQSVLFHSRFRLQTRGPAADTYKCAIAFGAQTLLLALLDSGLSIKYHQCKRTSCV